MNKDRQDDFWDVINTLNEIDILKYIIVMGSFAEYLYEDIFKEDYNGPYETKDIDLLYTNINKPNENVPLISLLKQHGFIYTEDSVSQTSKFYKDGDIELEFLTKKLGKGNQSQQRINSLGIISDSMRDINILDSPYEVIKNGYKIKVPEPSVFVIQKIIINEHRKPTYKRPKDIESIKNLLPHIIKSDYHRTKFIETYNNLSKNNKKIFHRVCEKENINIEFLNYNLSQIPKEIFTEEGYQELKELTNQINEIEGNNITNTNSHNSYPLGED